MAPQRRQHPGTSSRRRRIIEAALACFLEIGFAAATIEDIRARSGASVGSIYHHFGSKEQLAAAVYLDAMGDYQRGLVADLLQHAGARDGIFAMVHYHLHWVRDHPDRARYLSRMRHAEFMADTGAAMAEQNAAFLSGMGGWFRRQVAAGALRRVPPEIYVSLILGPCQEFARHWLTTGKARTDLEFAAGEIAKAAWQALRPNAEA